MRCGLLSVILAWTCLLLSGCSTGAGGSGGGGGGDDSKPDGTDGGICFPNGTCYGGLTCNLETDTCEGAEGEGEGEGEGEVEQDGPPLNEAVNVVDGVWKKEQLARKDTGGATVVPPKVTSSSSVSFDVEVTGVDAEHTLADVAELHIGVVGLGGHYVFDVEDDDRTAADTILVTVVQEDAALTEGEFSVQVVAVDAEGLNGEITEVTAAFFSASAGDDSMATVGETVALEATFTGGSGTPTVTWSQITGPDVSIATPSAASTTFVPPAVGTYVMRLEAVDPTGVIDVDLVLIQVVDAFTVEAGESRIIEVGDTVELQGLVGGGSGQATYEWTEISTHGVIIDNADSPGASFVPAATGEYEFEFKATDEINGEATDRVIHLAVDSLTARAAAPAEAALGDTIQLQGQAAGGLYPYAFRWSQTGGPTVALEDSTNQTALATLRTAGTYTFELRVVDSNGFEATGSVTIVSSGDDGPDGPCLVDIDCDDGLFCNGAETCVGGECQDGPPPCAPAVTTLADGLVAYYPFSGGADDASGNGNDGEVFGASLVVDRFGNSTSAYSFDGVDDYIDIGDDIKPPLPMTVSLWGKVGTPDPIAAPLFRNDTVNHAADRYGVAIGFREDGTAFAETYEGFSAPWNRQSIISSAPLSVYDAWQHLVVVFQSHDDMHLFLDGVEQEVTSPSGTGESMAYSSSGHGAIGMDYTGSARYYNGCVDDVRVYDRALSDEEIEALTNLAADGDPLAADETCDEVNDECTTSESVTDDGCPEGESCVDGECTEEEPPCDEDADCDDGDACTTDTLNVDSCECLHDALVCDDDRDCTEDTCDPVSGCIFTDICPEDTLCVGDDCVPNCAESDTICSPEWVENSIDTVVDLDQYTFTYQDGQCVFIQANGLSGGLDPQVNLFPPSGGENPEITVNSSNHIALLFAHTLAEDGQYTILLRDGQGDEAGDYLLSLLLLPGPLTSSQDPDGDLIAFDEAISAAIDVAADMDVYTFPGKAGQRVTIQANGLSGGLDPQINLFPPSGCAPEIVVDSSNHIALLFAYTLAEDGQYTILLRDGQGDEAGEYLLSLSILP